MGLSSIIGAGINAIGNYYNSKQQAKMTKQMIASQEKMNEQNVASQEKINQQNIDFQQGINNMMRSDAQNAISIKKRDLQNAGYSTADPNQQGFANAQLGSPELTAPQVESEFNPAMAQQELDARKGLVGSILEGARTFSDIELNKALARANNANATGQEIENMFKEAKEAKSYEALIEYVNNLKKEGVLKTLTAGKIAQEVESIEQTTKLIAEQVRTQQFINMWKPEEIQRNLKQMDAEYEKTMKIISNIEADTDVKKIEKDIKKLEKDIKGIEKMYAELGINWNSNDTISSLLRICTSEKGYTVIPRVVTFIKETLSETFTAIKEEFGFTSDAGGYKSAAVIDAFRHGDR